MAEIISLNQAWSIGEQVGSGGFGRVHLAQAANGETAVVKLVPKAPGAEREILFEDLDGVPNVVPILDRGEWGDSWVLVMPRAEKSLRDRLAELADPLSINDAIQVLANVAEALVAIEGRIVHRDIKPDNILLLDGRWRLADFGISRYAEATTAPDTLKFSMTPPYAAPEQWRNERATSATDVYAVGVVAYELLAGRLPFAGPAPHDYRRQHLGETPEPIPGVPPKLQSLMDECLYKSPEARPRPQNLLARLQEGVVGATSAAASRLQQANAMVVQQRAEAAREESVARSAVERRLELSAAAEQSLERIVGLLHAQIVLNAPAAKQSRSTVQRLWSLKEAHLRVAPSELAVRRVNTGTYEPPFEIVVYSEIFLRVQPDPRGYEGRSHSLWYCDAQEAGTFRWYETAFMIMPGMPRRSHLDPFAMDPGPDAYEALAPVLGAYQVAWPFMPIDQGDEDDFIERWLGWFAEAAQGQLRRPSRMPERDAHGTWRRG